MNPVQTLDWTISEATSCIGGADDRMQRMQIRHQEIGSDIELIYLAGRMDIMGVQKIELKFAAITSAQRKSVIVDLRQVELMNSVGLGLLITNANVMKTHGNVMILLKP